MSLCPTECDSIERQILEPWHGNSIDISNYHSSLPFLVWDTPFCSRNDASTRRFFFRSSIFPPIRGFWRHPSAHVIRSTYRPRLQTHCISVFLFIFHLRSSPLLLTPVIIPLIIGNYRTKSLGVSLERLLTAVALIIIFISSSINYYYYY